MGILSGYEIMWMIVLFDLPVVTPDDRKTATQFRKHLLDCGFSMSQFSVYYKVVPGKDKAARFLRLVADAVPPSGKVDILQITDKQYGGIVSIQNGMRYKNPEKGEQLALL